MKNNTTSYRYATEKPILFFTLFVVILVIAISATATFCFSAIFLATYVFLAYLSVRSHHDALLQQAHKVSHQRSPALYKLVNQSVRRLQADSIDVFIIPSKTMNAYTFGLGSPKVVVLHSSLLERLSLKELAFVLGHEIGHVRLGHTWLNTLVGGLAGIPAPASGFILLQFVFRVWNRACEYSADRAGLLVCGSLDAAISALIKIEAGPDAVTQAQLEAVAREIDAQDDTLSGNLQEFLRTHPLTINRIEALGRFARSRFYQTLLTEMDKNQV